MISTTGEDDDFIDGGEGIDWVTYASLEQGVQIFLGDDVGFAIVPDPHPGDLLPLQSDELIGIENAIGSRVGISSLGGNSADNVLIGLGPRTNFVSSAGDDTYQVQGKGHPAFFFLNDPGGIVFDLPAQRAEDGFGGIDCLRVEGSVEVLGSAFDDTLIGSPHRDWLDGYLGDDEIHGGGGSDILNGGRLGPNDGVDLIDGGRGSDWLEFWFVGVPPPVVVDLSSGTVTAAGETDTLQSIENVVAPEGPTEGSHVLIGDAGSNRFVSIGGDTIMTGGAGADRFQQAFGGLGDPDVITDFEKGRDLIYFQENALEIFSEGEAFDLIELGRLSPERFAFGEAQDADDLFIFDPGSGSLSIDRDGSGAENPVTVMIVENGVQIAASDIVIVEPIDEDLGRPGFRTATSPAWATAAICCSDRLCRIHSAKADPR